MKKRSILGTIFNAWFYFLIGNPDLSRMCLIQALQDLAFYRQERGAHDYSGKHTPEK